jgi:hypothetical protein
MKKLSWLLFLGLLAFSCQEDPDDQPLQERTDESIVIKRSKGSANARTTENGINCEEGMTFPVVVNGNDVGSAAISVGQTEITIDYDLTGNEWFLLGVHVFVGDCGAALPQDPTDYPYGQELDADAEVRTFSLEIPLDGLPECGCIRRVTHVARFNPNTSSIESYKISESTEYCSCEEPEEPDDENLRTQTPGGWGAPPNGNNPGAYLHANFADAFPNGLVVGCDFTVTFTSAQAITDGLPQGGKARALTQDYVNPVNTPKDPNNPKNTLLSHVVALRLSVTFDIADEDFGDSNTQLEDAVVTSGEFEGWTVAAVLAEAEKVLGGCASDYSASEVLEAISAINESFVDGTTDTGFLENGN